jgi:hypothetical protein
MDFNSLVETYPIDKPPEKLPLWPDPVATWNLGGDHWQAIRGFHTEATLRGRNFAFNVPPGFLVNVAALPATLRWFVKPHSQGGLVLTLWQYLVDRETVYDTEGQPLRLRPREICAMAMVGLHTTDAVTGWRLWMTLAQLTALSFRRRFNPKVNPRKIFMESHYEAQYAAKKSRKNDRAQRHP